MRTFEILKSLKMSNKRKRKIDIQVGSNKLTSITLEELGKMPHNLVSRLIAESIVANLKASIEENSNSPKQKGKLK